MQVVRGQRHGTHGRRPSLKGVLHRGCMQCGALTLSAPERAFVDDPSEYTTNEFCRFRQAPRITVVGTGGGGCNIHHLKGFGICVRRNRGEIDGGLDSRSNPVPVANAAPLFSQ